MPHASLFAAENFPVSYISHHSANFGPRTHSDSDAQGATATKSAAHVRLPDPLWSGRNDEIDCQVDISEGVTGLTNHHSLSIPEMILRILDLMSNDSVKIS